MWPAGRVRLGVFTGVHCVAGVFWGTLNRVGRGRVRKNIPPTAAWLSVGGLVVGNDRCAFARTRHACGTRVRQWCPRSSFQLTLLWRGFRLVCWYTPERGYFASSLLSVRDGQERLTVFPSFGRQSMKRIVLRKSQASDLPVHVAAVESAVFAKLHALVAHCAVTRYEDGEPRTPGWFTVKTYGSTWVVQIKDPDAAASLSCTASSLDDALALADLMLTTADAPWEHDQFLAARKGSKKR